MRAGRNANGAGIAADPTLTGVWMTLARDASGEPSASSAGGHAWRPMSSLSLPCLAAGFARDLSPALAPASGFRLWRCCVCRSPKPPSFRCHAPPLGRSHVPLPIFTTAAWGLSPSPLRFRSARFLACPVPSRRSHFQQGRLHSAEASCMPSLDERVDRCHRHPWDKNSGNFKALRLSVPVASSPEDKLKVRLNRRSDNIRSFEFSTAGHLACGHEWISQRLVAIVANLRQERERNRLETVPIWALRGCAQRGDSVFPGLKARQVSRLRRDSRRRRRPFNLMKPSASFWS